MHLAIAVLLALVSSARAQHDAFEPLGGEQASSTQSTPGKLVESGLMREVGSGPKDPKRRYFLARSS